MPFLPEAIETASHLDPPGLTVIDSSTRLAGRNPLGSVSTMLGLLARATTAHLSRSRGSELCPLAYVASTLPVVRSVPAAVVKYCTESNSGNSSQNNGTRSRCSHVRSRGSGECMVVLSLLSHSQ